ncbi:MAG: HNH endonuclease [Acidobacteriota bacterium]|nr:HNH endonuclease [Acidobacteriota bacterium]
MASNHPTELTLTEQDIQRFLTMMPSGKPGECWEWPKIGSRGYGYFAVHHEGDLKKRWRNRQAHRVSWYIVNGPIPDGLLVCHKCDNPPCVNPGHLFIGDFKGNAADMVAKGRHKWTEEARRKHFENVGRGKSAPRSRHPERYPVGEKATPWAKLDADIIKAIREEYARQKTPSTTLAIRYSVSKQTILRIIHRRAWKHVA